MSDRQVTRDHWQPLYFSQCVNNAERRNCKWSILRTWAGECGRHGGRKKMGKYFSSSSYLTLCALYTLDYFQFPCVSLRKKKWLDTLWVVNGPLSRKVCFWQDNYCLVRILFCNILKWFLIPEDHGVFPENVLPPQKSFRMNRSPQS